MSVESDLRKDGIEVVEQLDTLTVNSIAKNISDRLANTFPEFNLNSGDLFIKLSRLNMYKAKMPDGMAEANYFYKNSSIYFNEHVSFEDLEEFAIHECIHYLQEIKDKKNYLVRMGLCDFTEFKIYGMGLNEAAVQLMTSKIIGIKKEYVKYYGIDFPSTSPSYYPVECNLIKQMAYITGEDILFKSTFFSTDDFKNKFISLTSEPVFYAIQNALDTILYAEESIIKLNNKLQEIDERTKQVANIMKKIDAQKKKVSLTFMRTQNLIISSYFDNEFNRIQDLEELENYRKHLYNFKDLIGTADGYTFFNNYYIEKMAQLEHKYNILENGGIETAIEPQKTSKLMFIINKIKKLFTKEKSTNENWQ